MVNLRTLRKKLGPRASEGVRIYAVGDVHGRADLLDQTLRRIDTHLGEHPACRAVQVFLGDYIDRGPESQEVLELLIARARAHETVYLKGNHETYLVDFLKNVPVIDQWRQYGGLETLMSYGLAPSLDASPAEHARLAAEFRRVLPESHLQFLRNLTLSFSCGDFFFVHAGVRPGIPLAKQREQDLLWIREDFLLYEENFSKFIVHGHTPVLMPDIRPNRVNIDTGAYATGKLTCLVVEQDELFFL